MKRKAKEIFNRIIATVLIIALLPFGDFQKCLTVRAQEIKTSDAPEQYEEAETSNKTEESEERAIAEQPDELSEKWALSEDCILSDDKVVDGLILEGGTLNLNGCSLTVLGDMIQSGGVLWVNGGTLTVEGDYLMLSEEPETAGTGLLRMTTEEDRVCVRGDLISETNQDSTDALTAGVLEVRGDILIRDTYSRNSFVASGNHTLLLSGEDLQTVDFAGSAYNRSRVRNLEIANTSDEGVHFVDAVNRTGTGNQKESALCVTGHVNDNGNTVSGFITMAAGTTFEEGYFGGNIYIDSELSLDSVLTIGGDCRFNANAHIPISGNLTVKGDLLQSCSRLRMEQGSLIVEGDYRLFQSSYSQLQMTHEQDYIHVYGDVEFNPYYETAWNLTAGTFEVGGDLNSRRGIQATGKHCFVFSGDAKQTVRIAESEYFANVELKNHSPEGVWSEEVFAHSEMVTNGCKISYGDYRGVYGWTLEEDEVYQGDLVLIEDTLDLNGHRLTVTGDLVQLSGTVLVNGGSLIVEGDYRLQSRRTDGEAEQASQESPAYLYGKSAGRLRMNDEQDRVCVKGSYLSDSLADTTGALTAGVLEIQGDMIVNADASQMSFAAEGTHTLLLSGKKRQNVFFGKSGKSLSRLCNLEITNTSEEGVVFERVEERESTGECENPATYADIVYVSGMIDDHGNAVQGYIAIGDKTSFAQGNFGGSILIRQDISVKDSLVIGGALRMIEKGNLNLSGSVTVKGDMIQENGFLNLRKGSLIVEGDYTLRRGGASGVRMQNAEDFIHVYGDVVYDPNYPYEQYLTAGTFEVGGDFITTADLQVGGTHRFVFSGTGKQIISIGSGGYFAIVELKNYSADGVYSENAFTTKQLITNGCRITYGDLRGEYGWTLTGDEIYEGDLILLEDTLDLNGHSLTVTGDLIQFSGTVAVHGGRLTVEGDYRMQSRTAEKTTEDAGQTGMPHTYTYGRSTGRLQMTNETDYVCVRGSYLSDSSADGSGDLTAGTMELWGDVIVNSAYSQKSFVATGTHTLLLAGADRQTLRFGASGEKLSRLCNLEIANSSEAGVLFDSAVGLSFGVEYHTTPIYVSGLVNDNGNPVSGCISIGTGTDFAENSFGGSISVGQGIELDDTLEIGGDMELTAPSGQAVKLSGTILVKGSLVQTVSSLQMEKGSLTVEGDYFLQNGKYSCLRMNHEEDAIRVRGNVNYNPYTGGGLTAGIFEVGGDLISSRGLNAAGTHKFIFSGEEGQTVNIADNEYFAVVELQNHSEAGVYSDKPFVSQELIRNGCRITYGSLTGEYGFTLTEDMVYEGDLVLLEDTLDLNGYSLTVKGNLKQISGTVYIHGGSLTVEGDYLLRDNSSGRLRMTDAADRVCVKGSYLSDSAVDGTGYLTAGILEIRGDLIVDSSRCDKSFVATGEHTVLLSGIGAQRVFFGKSAENLSRLCNLEIENDSPEGVWFDSATGTWGNRSYHKNPVYVTKQVKDDHKTVRGCIGIGTQTVFTEEYFGAGVNVNQSSVLDGTVTIGGDLELTAPGNASVSIRGQIRAEGNLLQIQNRLSMEKGSLEIGGDYTLEYAQYSQLHMTHSEDYLYVHGNVTYNPYYNGIRYLTAGTFEIGGNLISRRGIQAGGTHRFLFSGTEKQIIDIAADEYFATVELKNYSEEGVYSETVFGKTTLIRNGCKLRFGNLEGEYGWTLTEDMVYEGDLVLLEDTLDLNGHSLTVNGDLIQISGVVAVNGGSLTVEGDYRLQSRIGQEGNYTYGVSSGQLRMTNAADRVTVCGNMFWQTNVSTKDKLSAGALEIKGNFIQTGANAYLGTGGNTLIFSGGQTQLWKQEKAGTVGHIVNRSGRKLTVNGDTTVYGSITDEKGTVAGSGALVAASPEQLTTGSWSGTLKLTGKNILKQDIQVGHLILEKDAQLDAGSHTVHVGQLTLNGRLELQKAQLFCTGDCAVSGQGTLVMEEEAGYLMVGGSFRISSRVSHRGLLTDGVLELRGHFTQEGYANFIATDNHTVILARKQSTVGRDFLQSIAFNNNPGTTCFQRLVLRKSLQNYQFKNDINTIAREIVYELEDDVSPSPVAAIRVEDTTETSVTLSYSEAEDESGILGYEICRDGVRVGVTSSTVYTDTGLSPGRDYIYTVYAFDSYRNAAQESPKVSARTGEDTESPAVPAGLSVYTRTGSSVTLRWNPATDNVGVTGYELYRDGALLARGSQTMGLEYRDSGLEPDQIYHYSVAACDASGNTSALSESVEAVAAMPRITRITPEDHSAVGNGEIPITVCFANVGNAVGNRVTMEYLDGQGQWTMITPSALPQKTYNATTFYVSYNWMPGKEEMQEQGERDHTLRITLYDADGNTDVREVVCHVDRQAPALPENLTAMSENGTVVLSWDASGSADCAVYEIYRRESDGDADSAETYTLLAELAGRYETCYEDSTVVLGRTYSYALVTKDAFGNESAFSESVTVQTDEDREPPRVKKITPNAGRIHQTTEITVTASDNRGVAAVCLQYRAEEQQEWNRLAEVEASENMAVYQWDTTVLPDGVYILNAVAIDENGNRSSEEFTRRYELDNTGIGKLRITEISPTSTAVQLAWEDVTETDFAYFQIEQLVGTEFVKIGTASDALGYNVTGLSPNCSYSFQVVGYDDLGTRGIPSDSVTVSTEEDTVVPVVVAVYPAASDCRDALELQVVARDNDIPAKAVFSVSRDGVDYQKLAEVENHKKGGDITLDYHFDVSSLPEGSLYVKFEVYDRAGNKNAPLSDGKDVVVEYRIDRTAPARVEKPEVTGEEGYVGLCWNDNVEEDVEAFRIYRCDGDEGVYRLIEPACVTKNYCDTNVTEGISYTYKVSAVDRAGNEGECSQEVCAMAREDTQAPSITGVSPEDYAMVRNNPLLQVAATDNAGLSHVTLEYRSADSGIALWTPLARLAAEGRAEYVSTVWNTEDLQSGAYRIRAVAYDRKGNASLPCELFYTLDNIAPEQPVVTAKTGHFEVLLDIQGGEDMDFDHFEIMRRMAGTEEFVFVGRCEDQSFTDKDVLPNTPYFYQVTSYDHCGNSSCSEEVQGTADDVDKIRPKAVLPENLVGLVGMEMVFDGSASTDNVRIVKYEWKLGNGDRETGSRIVYSYDKPGDYTVTLKVRDAAGNIAATTANVHIYEKTGNGLHRLKVQDDRGNAIPYATVYVRGDTENLSLKTDREGKVTIAAPVGIHEAAVYRNGYLPEAVDVRVSNYETKESTVTLTRDELIVGSFSVRRMTLEEMVEAGVDFSSPANLHSFVFRVTLVFEEKAIPTEYRYIPNENNMWESWWSHEEDSDGKKHGGQYIRLMEWGGGSDEGGEPQPVFAYIRTTQSVSWLKDMFEVQLGICNAADSRFVIKNATAKLNLPSNGVSLADTVTGQTLRQSIDSIAGQESRSVSWVIKGDKSGSYSLSADVAGTLMPFRAPVSAHFETESDVRVETGEGLHIYVMPEETGYIGEDYYIQFMIANESNRPFYNFTTSIGEYRKPENEYTVTDADTGETYTERSGAVVVDDPSNVSQSVVVRGGRRISFKTLYPGQRFYGTYVTTFPAGEGSTADPNDVYYQLIDSFVDVLQGENLGVEVDIVPIRGHISRSKVKFETLPSYYGDPIDLASGAFTESVEAMSVPGGTPLAVNFYYDSRITETQGELGYGWRHDYEYHLEDHNGTIRFYRSPSAYAYFVKADALQYSFYGEALQDGTLMAQGEEYSYGEYVCLNSDMADYRLIKSADNTYTVIAPGGLQYRFDERGRLTRLTDENGKYVSLSYQEKMTTITESISGRKICLHYNGEGLLTSVTDDNGRKTAVTYDENKNISAIRSVSGETVNYSYDETHRILSESGKKGIIVRNEYDSEGRVTRQTDACGAVMELTYLTDEDGITTVMINDADGTVKDLKTDKRGRIVSMTNGDGGTARYTYDANDNLTSEADACGNAVFREYDSRGNLLKVTDTGNITTEMTYDSHGNVLTVHGTLDRNASYTYDSRNLMTSMTDTTGMRTAYAYNADGQLIRETVEGLGYVEYTYEKGQVKSVRDYNGGLTTFVYDAYGNCIRTTDALGNVTKNEYDLLGHVTKTTDALGNTTVYTYDYVGALTSVTDALGNTVTYEYDNAGRKTREVCPDGTSVRYSYDALGRNIRTTYADGTYRSYTYDAAGNLAKETLPDGSAISYTYDLLGQRISETDQEGNKIAYAYYPNGNLQKVTYPDGSTELYTYNQAWKVSSVTDRTGNSTAYEYDAKSNLTLKRDAMGNEWRNTYDKYGRLIAETDANGNTTTYAYDANSNCIQKTNALGVTVTMEYDALNRLTKACTRTKDGQTYSIGYTYDALGRVLSTTDELGHTTRMTYDALGNLVSITDAEGVTTRTAVYDSMGRTAATTDALGITTHYTYDAVGQLIRTVKMLNGEETDGDAAKAADNRITAYTYDALGRMTSVTDPMAGVTSAAYDKRGNLASVTDANGGTTTYSYDKMGQLTAQLSPLGSKTTYTYDAGGLLIASQNARNQKTQYTYDAAGRVTAMTDELGTVSYTYDPNGNILTVTDGKGTISRKYDALNRVTEYTDYKGDTVKYAYDEIGNLIALTYPSGEIVRYTYYKNGWLHKVIDTKGQVTEYTYDARGNLTHTKRPNGTGEICAYNEAGLLVSQKDVRGEEVLAEYTYTYDESGNVTAIQGIGTTDTEEGLNRLSAAGMTYDAENRLITYNGEKLRYDADGNMTYGPVNGVMTELTYDCRNRLVSAGGITYTYDAENNRIQAETEEYKEEYFNDTVSASLSRVLTITVTPKERADRTGNNATDGNATSGNTASGSTTVCIYGNGLIYERNGDIYRYHHYNNLGSTMKLTDARGQVIASYTYGVYGELLSGDTGFTRFLYNGRCGVATDDNGLYYMRQRYYNPEIKRFVNQDVLTGSISNSQSLNRYSYVQGNPVSYTDPFGLSPTNGLFTGTTFAHCLFAVLGCIPGPVGVAANLADALIYALVDHDYLMTGVSLLGALTLGAGGIAGMAVKGSKLARGARGVQFASGFLASGIMFAKNADNAAQVGRGLFDKYAVRKEPFSQKTLQELSALNLALAGCGMSAYGMAGNGQALAKVLKEAQVTSRLKNLCQTHALNNGGYVDADAFKANGAKASRGGKKGIGKTNFDNETPRSGSEWNQYLKGKYGADNVHWNINSVDDIFSDPTRLKGYTVDELQKVLGDDWIRGVYGSNGDGWKLTNDDVSIFYHPGGGKHGGAYYGISSGATGKIKVVNPKTYIPLKGDKATIIYD